MYARLASSVLSTRPTRTLLVAAVACAMAACATSGDSAPDMVLTGGRIFTADSAMPWVEALAIRDGRIIAAGNDEAIGALAAKSTRRVALAGRVVIPGINDAHVHLSPSIGVPFKTSDDPTPDPSLAPVVDSIAVLVTRAPEGTWLTTPVAAAILEDPRARRVALDRVSPAHPVLLQGWSGHGAVLNTAALRVSGLLDSADPVGGWLERDRAGLPTGRIDEYALYNLLRRITAARGAATMISALRQYDGMAANFGITSVQNMATGFTPATLAEVDRAMPLRVRHRLIPFEMTSSTGRESAWNALRARAISDSARVGASLISGRKWILDGTPIERLALVRTPYADRARWYGRANFPPDTLRAMIAEALRDNVQPIFHAVGDSAIALVLSALDAAAPDTVWQRIRPRIEHGDMLLPDQLAEARRLGVVIVQNPTHLALSLLRTRWGTTRTTKSEALKSIVAAGIPLALGSDGADNPYLNIMFASINPVNPAEALTREQAVRAYTYGSAYAEGMERVKGRLVVGMLADLVVLSQDIFTVPADALPATTSLLTLVGGKATLDKLSSAPR